MTNFYHDDSKDTMQDGPIQLEHKITLASPDNKIVRILWNVRYNLVLKVCEVGILYVALLGSSDFVQHFEQKAKLRKLDQFPSSVEENENAYSDGFSRKSYCNYFTLGPPFL
jgi:hypothetical protein